MSKRFVRWTVLAVTFVALLGENTVAQEPAPAGGRRNRRNQEGGQTQRGNRGTNLDPAQLQERVMTRYRERLEAKEDEEWNRLKPKIEKVLAAQREGRLTGTGLARRTTSTDAAGDENANRRRENRQPEAGTVTDPDVAALRAAVEANASAAELKPKLAKVREKIKAREAALADAREDLRKELSPRQEAIAAMMGLLR